MGGRRELIWYLVWPLLLGLVGLGLVATGPSARAATATSTVSTASCGEASLIGNGTITLGVNCLGDLGTDQSPNTKGLRYEPTGAEAVNQACSCEGWGVADLDTGVTGYVNQTPLPDDAPGTSANVSLVDFNATATTATSVVDVGTTFRVTQDFRPSPQTANLYEASVTVANISGAATHLRYRRVMDWDIEPTPQSEYVTLDRGTSQRVLYTSDDGFASSNPLAGPSKVEKEGSFTDSGPSDHGALFDFDFGSIAAGATRSFKIFYGAAPDEARAQAALNAVNAEAYSFGQPNFADPDSGNTTQGPTTGAPNTFIFGFKDIDGASLFAPVARSDGYTAYTEVDRDLNVLANDYDPNGDPLTITGHTDVTHGTLTCTAIRCSYRSDVGYLGPDTFTYTVSDGNGGTDSTVVQIEVVPVPANKPPVAVDDTLALDEDTAGTVSVLANDSDADPDDVLTVSDHTAGAHGTVACTATACTYTPRADWNGTDSFTYDVTDGKATSTATVAVTVRPVNDAPVAVTDPQLVTDEDTAVTASLAGNDTDVDGDTLTATPRALPAHGTLTCSGASCTYTPEPDWSGTDSFTYRAYDGTAYSGAMSVAVRVDPVNDAPVAGPDTLTAAQATAATVAVLGNDDDVDGDPLAVTGHTDGAHGTVTCTDTECTYTGANAFFGADSFTYTVSDGQGGTATATVTVTVTKVDRPPVAVDDTAATDEDVAVRIPVTVNDIDPDNPNADLRALLVTGPAHGTVTCSGATCTYTPDADWHGTDGFTYRTSDGELDSAAPARVEVTVAPVNDPPVAVTDTAAATAGTALDLAVLANDTDVDGDPLTVTAHTAAAHGTVTCADTGCTYTGDDGYAGTDSFAYTVSDGHGGTAQGTVRLTVSLPNRAPTANPDTATGTEDRPVTFGVLGNDTDPDGDRLSLVTAATTTPTVGAVTCTAAGSCTYTPPADWSGTTSFGYTADDGHGHTAEATVSVTVAPVNDAPVPGRDRLTVDRDRIGSVSVLVNDNDVDGDPLTVLSATKPLDGQVACTGSGVCTFTPKAHWAGSTSFTYVVSDGTATATGTVDVTVRPVVAVPDAPTIGTPSNRVVVKAGRRYNATATWKAPAWDGGSPITKYKVTVNRMKNGQVASSVTYTAAKTARSLLLSLKRGVKYTFQVSAVNQAGAGPLSARSRTIKTR